MNESCSVFNFFMTTVWNRKNSVIFCKESSILHFAVFPRSQKIGGPKFRSHNSLFVLWKLFLENHYFQFTRQTCKPSYHVYLRTSTSTLMTWFYNAADKLTKSATVSCLRMSGQGTWIQDTICVVIGRSHGWIQMIRGGGLVFLAILLAGSTNCGSLFQRAHSYQFF